MKYYTNLKDFTKVSAIPLKTLHCAKLAFLSAIDFSLPMEGTFFLEATLESSPLRTRLFTIFEREWCPTLRWHLAISKLLWLSRILKACSSDPRDATM